MLLPMGRAHDGGNRRSLWSAQHRKHASLFRTRPAVARRASFGLRLARMMLFTSGRLCRNGNPLAGGESFCCRWFDFAGGGRADARLLGSSRHVIVDIDRCEAGLGDAKRHRSAVVIASPDRERATGADLLQQAGADQFVDDLSGGLALDVRRQFNSAIIALRSRGKNDELRIGKSCHRDPPLRRCGVVCRHHHSPTLAMQPAGQDPEARLGPGTVALPLCSRTNASPFWIQAELARLGGEKNIREFVPLWLGGQIIEDDPFHALISELISEIESPDQLLDALLEAVSRPDIPPDVAEVRIMSLHKSKGL